MVTKKEKKLIHGERVTWIVLCIKEGTLRWRGVCACEEEKREATETRKGEKEKKTRKNKKKPFLTDRSQNVLQKEENDAYVIRCIHGETIVSPFGRGFICGTPNE